MWMAVGALVAALSFGVGIVLTLLKPTIGADPTWTTPIGITLAIGFWGGMLLFVVAAAGRVISR